MFKQDKIKAIYEKVADKTLSFGCKIQDENWKQYIFWNMCTSWNSFDTITKEWWIDRFYYPMRNNINIWHSVMIWDIIDYLQENYNLKPNESLNDYFKIERKILNRYEEKRKPIEEQSEECIDYVYNLIFEKW